MLTAGRQTDAWNRASHCLGTPMTRSHPLSTALCAAALGIWAVANGFGSPSPRKPFPQDQPASQTKQGSADDSRPAARMARGKKLMLKDGNFQLVREYERKGERVRYFSVERGAWEEIPAAMVDWDATAKAEADSEKASAALLSKIHAQEEATKIETVLDVDASLQVAPGVFLPPGEGLFVIEGQETECGNSGSKSPGSHHLQRSGVLPARSAARSGPSLQRVPKQPTGRVWTRSRAGAGYG